MSEWWLRKPKHEWMQCNVFVGNRIWQETEISPRHICSRFTQEWCNKNKFFFKVNTDFVSWLKIMLYKPDELCSGSESGEHPEIVLAGDLANTDVLKVNVFMYFTVSFWFWLAYMSDQKDVLLYLSTVHKMKTKHPDGYFANSSTFEKSKAEDTAGVPTITHISQQSTMYLKYRCNFGDVCSVHIKHRI